jgi:hypothetical protein
MRTRRHEQHVATSMPIGRDGRRFGSVVLAGCSVHRSVVVAVVELRVWFSFGSCFGLDWWVRECRGWR